MSVLHFLNVLDGDCHIIKHDSSRITVIDVNNASKTQKIVKSESFGLIEGTIKGNFNQKKYPVNPVEYMNSHAYTSVFRFILTHPDMDHMGGIKDFFSSFSVSNFWDTENKKAMGSFEGSPYNEDDWKYYQKLRSNPKEENIILLNNYAGAEGIYYNKDDSSGNGYGDGIYILAPFSDLIDEANKIGEYNDASYVILMINNGKKIIFGGDSHDKTWDKILDKNSKYRNYIENIDVLIAPHHGRKSGRKYDYLDVLNPKLTLIGNAGSEHIAYSAWNYRKLEFITNNQANCVILNIQNSNIEVYVTCENFAKKVNSYYSYSPTYKAYYIGAI